jgi:hypothetical protein
VHAADDKVAWSHLGSIGKVELQCHPWERVEEVGVGRCDARCVEQSCDCAIGFRNGCGVVEVACVVLRTSTDSDMLESEAGCWWW